MFKRRWAYCLLLLPLFGCGSGEQGGLTDDQAQAVESVTRLTKWLGRVEGSFADLAKLDRIGPALLGQNFGQCPKISVRPQGVGATVALTYSGCDNLAFVGGQSARGTVSVGLDLLKLTGNLGFEQFNLAGKAVNGGIALKPFEGGRLDNLQLQLNNLQVEDIGTLNGQTGLLIAMDGGLGMRAGQIQMRDILGSSFGVKLAEIRINPLRNGNALPEQGSVAFDVPIKLLTIDHVEMQVKFNEFTPRDGSVDVMVGPLGPFRYRLKHLAE